MCLRSGKWLGALFLPLALSGLVSAAETGITPAVEVRQEYTDNLFSSPTGPIGTFITRVSPGIKAFGRTERLSGSASARLNALHYSENSDMDKVDQRYEVSGSGRLSPRLSLSGSAAYRQESWPDREIETSGQTLNTTSYYQNYGAGTGYQISELTAASLSYGYEQIGYSNQNQFSGVTTHSASAGLEHDAGRLFPLLKLRGSANYSRSDYETTQIDNYELTIGASRNIHELWSVSADAGGRYTRSAIKRLAFDPLTGLVSRSDTDDTAGWVFKTALDYSGESLWGGLSYSRDVSNSSGRFGTAVERDIVTISIRKRLTLELFALLNGGYFHSMAGSNQFGSQQIDETSVRGSLSLRYEFNRSVAADFGYDYFRLENTTPGSTANRNKVFIQLTAQTNLFE